MMLDQCAHLHIPLSTGWIEGQCVVCPWHQWKYNAKGHCVWPPASSEGVPVFPIREDKGILWLLSTETTSTWISYLFSRHWKDMEKVAAMKEVHMIGYKETTRVWCAGADLEEAQSRLDEIRALYLPH